MNGYRIETFSYLCAPFPSKAIGSLIAQRLSQLAIVQSLYDKIKKIEALILNTNVEGERQAAMAAKKRLLENVPAVLPQHAQAIEFTLTTGSDWNKQLVLALCGKYQLRPYRYYRQKYTTVMVRCNKTFMDKVFWPEYLEYSQLLSTLVQEITTDLIAKIHKGAEEEVISGQLGDGQDGSNQTSP